MGHAFVSSVKRKLGRETEVELVGGQRKPAWEVASEIFRHLRDHAQQHAIMQHSKEKIAECVVTVPVDFSGRQRSEIRRAMQRAGLKLKSFLHEPFAAMVSHFYDPVTKLSGIAGKRTIVFDWGGGTLDVCITEVSSDGSNVFEVSHDGIADRAGDEFDLRVMQALKHKFIGRSGLQIDDLPLRGNAPDRFRLAAEQCKIALSSSLEQRVEVPSLFEAFGKLHDLEETMRREEFEEVVRVEIDAAEACVQRCLNKAGLTPGLIDYVLLVGGTSNIPAVRSMMERVFGARVAVAYEPDAAIARGAAIVAAEEWVPYNVKDVGVLLSDGTMFPVLPGGHPLLPSESQRFSFYCIDPRDGVARIQIVEKKRQGDRAMSNLADCMLVKTNPGIREVRSLDRISAQFIVTEDATLHVVAQSAATGKQNEIDIHDLCFGLKLR
jgi:molecular chaperone DnaK